MENDFDRIDSPNELLTEDSIKSDNAVGGTVLQDTVSNDQINSNVVLETDQVVENGRVTIKVRVSSKKRKK